jgi:hypothetical protein
MRLNLVTALTLALLSSMLPACERTATDREEAASRGATAGQNPASDKTSGSKAPR